MSGAIDKMTADETKMLDQMREDEQSLPELEPAAPARLQVPDLELEENTAIDDAAPQEGKRKGTVPHAALHAERESRKALAKQLEETNLKAARDLATVEERYRIMASVVQQAQGVPAPASAEEAIEIPDVNVDPVGHFKAQLALSERSMAKLAKQIEESSGLVKQVAETQLRDDQMRELQTWGSGQEAAFAAITPDYLQAMEHLRSTQDAMLQAFGITDPRDRHARIGQMVTGIATQARQAGVSFPEQLYNIAKASGWRTPAPTVPTEGEDVEIFPLVAPTAAERAALADRGRDMAAGINVPGAAPRGPLTADQVARMTDTQFAALMAKSTPEQIRNLMGA